MSQVRGLGYWEGILGPPEGPGRGLRRGTPHPGNRLARGSGSPGLARGPWESERGRPRQAGPGLPVQGLHAGLPGTSGRAPRNPRRPPAARRSRARTPGTLATRRRRRWPVHGAPSPPPPGGSRSQKGSGAWKVSPRTSCAEIRSPPAQAAAAISCHLVAPLTHKAARAGVGRLGGGAGVRGAGGWGQRWAPHPHQPTWEPARGAGTRGRGLRA